LANSIGKAKQTVNHYKSRVPADVCPLIERATGVRCEALRPDINWVRVPDSVWLNGRPLVDATRPNDRASASSITQSDIDPYVCGATARPGAKSAGDRPSIRREEK
jgi:DNA-binding transcriptional regulator YdaS (Cro superfamily)